MANATTHAAICHPCFLDSELAGTSKKQRSSGDLMVVAEREIRLLIGVGRISWQAGSIALRLGFPRPTGCFAHSERVDMVRQNERGYFCLDQQHLIYRH